MMLLNNDYYLDAKSMIMSTEVSSLIENSNIIKNVLNEHINDESLHGKKPIVIQNITQVISGEGSFTYYNNELLKNDLIVYLPISYSVAKLNEIIANVPHNLNSHNIVFLFVIPEGYNSENDEFIINVEDDSINFSNFYNGTIFVVGDFLQQTNFFDKFTYKNTHKIENPVKNDGINIKKYIINLFNEIDNPENINDIIKYENNEELPNNKKLNKIIIEGTALNENYSLITFNDITANVYIKNLKFRNTLKPEYDGSNYISSLNLKSDLLPSEDKFLFSYPLEDNLTPILGTQFLNYLNAEFNRPIFEKLTTYIDMINSGCLIFENNLNNENGLINILNNHKIYEFNDIKIVSQSVIYELAKNLENILAITSLIKQNEPSINYSDYFNDNGTFVVDEIKADLNHYLTYVNDFIKSIDQFFVNPNFIQFLLDRPDLISNDLVFDENNTLDIYKEQYFNQGKNYILSGYIAIQDEILSMLFEGKHFTESMEFSTNGNVISNKIIDNVYNSNIKTNYSDGSVKAYELGKNISNNIENGYFSIQNEYSALITKLIFEHKIWNNLRNKFESQNYQTELNDSRYDTTICFWRKHIGKSMDEVTYLSFKFNDDSYCNFIIKGYSAESYHSDDKTTLSFLTDDLYTKYKSDWQFWSIRVSNQFLENTESDLSGKIGIICDVYVNELEDGEYKIKKFTLTGESENDVYMLTSPLAGENSNLFENSKIYLGYSNFKEGSNENKNYFNGYIRNFMLFAGHLTDNECRGIFNAGIQQSYNFTNDFVNEDLFKLFNSKNFFIGLIGVYNVSNINILNCVMKYNGKYLK